MPFTIPPSTKILGNAGHTTDHNSITTVLTDIIEINVLNTAYAGGADPTGVADSTAAIQAAINARGTTAANDATFTNGSVQTIFIPYGTYKIGSGPLKPTTPLRSLRIVSNGATLISTANAIFDFNGIGNLLDGSIEISGLNLDATGGHVFQNANVHGMVHIHHCNITQRSTGFGIWNNDDIANANVAGSGIYLATFDHINYWLGTGTRTVEAWRFVTNLNEAFGAINFEYVNGPNPPGNTATDGSMDTAKYQFYFQCSGASQGTQCSSISWRNCDMSDAYGGLIKCAGISNVTIDGNTWGNTFDAAITNDAYSFVPDPVNSTPCNGIVLKNCFRDTALGNQAGHAPPYDISCDASTVAITIENYVTPWSNAQGPYFNLNGCHQAIVIQNANHTTTPTINNQAFDTIYMGQGFMSVGGNRVAYSSGGKLTVGNTTTETSITSYSVPANDPAAGATYEAEAVAVITTSGATAQTVLFDLWYGGTKICAGTAITTAVTGSGIYFITAKAFFDSATTVIGKLQIDYLTSGTSGTVTATQIVSFTGSGAVTVTPAQNFTVTSKFSVTTGTSALTSWYTSGRKC